MLGEYYNIDCMELMSRYPDKHFDLAIVDPPYGIKNMNAGGRGINGWTKWENKKWDSAIPSEEYFNELFRVSKNQIIWGGNYFISNLCNTSCLIIWDKGQREFSLADGEIAWASFDKPIRIFTFHRALANQEKKIHPTQKPVKLYEWLLTNYAKPNDLILDTHCGSASSLIACENLGFKYVASELDKDYYSESLKRLKTHLMQGKLFQPVGGGEIK